ncbi:very long chain fatty acid elongase 6-like [Panulirus ornatus]|uniref:very long chain fatty acid elongase 6-like n=1 Tax=Panulirus ornatus TaxID=150431 RepID=UPI003A8A6FED
MSFYINLTNVEAAAGRSLYNMSYNLVMPFEGNFYGGNWVQWFDRNWGIVFYMVGAYMAVVFGVQAWMENRPAYDLRKQLFVWNVILAVFSLYGGIRSLQELIYVYTNFGLYSTYCLCGLRWHKNITSNLRSNRVRPCYKGHQDPT